MCDPFFKSLKIFRSACAINHISYIFSSGAMMQIFKEQIILCFFFKLWYDFFVGILLFRVMVHISALQHYYSSLKTISFLYN